MEGTAEASGLLLLLPLSDFSRLKTLLMRLTYLPRLLRRSASLASAGGVAPDDDMLLLFLGCSSSMDVVVGYFAVVVFSGRICRPNYPRIWLRALTETRAEPWDDRGRGKRQLGKGAGHLPAVAARSGGGVSTRLDGGEGR